MAELTPEAFDALTKRVEALEKKLIERHSPPACLEWLKHLPKCEDAELMRQVHAEIAAAREAEREAARAGVYDEPHIVE